MSTPVVRDAPRPPAGPHDVPVSLVGASLLAALQAAAASLVVVMVPVVSTWVAAAEGTAAWADAVRLGLDLWVLAQHGGIVVPGGHVGLVPLGLSVAPLAACWFTGRKLARVLDPRGERIRAGASRATPAFPPLRSLILFAAGYAVLAGLAAFLGGMPAAQPIIGQAFVGAGTVALVAGGLGAVAYRFGSGRAGLRALVRLLPPWSRGWVRPVAAVLALHLAASVVLLVALLVAHRDQVLVLHRALQPGLFGGAVLVLAQLLLTPDLTLWAASVIAGPGFAIGAGSSVTASSVTLGPLPALPVLAALPAPGQLPAAAGALPCVPVLAGLVAGAMLLQDREVSWWRQLLDAIGVAAGSGLALTVLAWLSGGPAGPGRLAVTGPVAWQVGAASAVEVGLGALTAVAAFRAVPAIGRRALDRWRDDSAHRDWVWDEGPDTDPD